MWFWPTLNIMLSIFTFTLSLQTYSGSCALQRYDNYKKKHCDLPRPLHAAI